MKALVGLMPALLACGTRPPYIKVDRVALGRVVVYRNGVAYYERRATVEGGSLSVSVPRDRVDDFLKSLTVVDAISGKPLPVSIPRRTDDDGAFLTMRLQLPSRDKADVVLTYVTEAPAWKPSYRVVVGEQGKVMLEGWAVVDNTSGEDWKGVLVGVGSSSALSFRYDLWSVRQPQRETLADDEQFAVAPPQGVSPYGGPPDQVATAKPSRPDTPIVDFSDRELIRPDPKPQKAEVKRRLDNLSKDVAVRDRRLQTRVEQQRAELERRAQAKQRTMAIRKDDEATGSGEGSQFEGEYWRDELGFYRSGETKLKNAASQLVHSSAIIVIEATADDKAAGGKQRALTRANLVKNKLIDAGIAASRIAIETRVEPGLDEKAVIRTRPAKAQAHPVVAHAELDITAAPVGESHFTSAQPMTVERGASAMVSMVRSQTDGEVVYLYDAESTRGNEHFAFRAVRFRNPTGSTLETGPVTVYGNERFIGEGLTEPIPPAQSAVVPYALDRQIVVEKTDSSDTRLSRLVALQRGVLTAQTQQIRRTGLVLTNRVDAPATVYVRHTLKKGWTLLPTAAALGFERAGEAHLFQIKLGPREVKRVEIAEATPIEKSFDLGADSTLAMMALYLDTPDHDPHLDDQLRKLLAAHKHLVDLATEQDSRRRRLADYKERLDDLHGQIVTLQAVKTGGDLMTHLKAKMTEISDRVQKATIAIVDQEQKILLARVQFQDLLADLTLPDAIAKASSNP